MNITIREVGREYFSRYDSVSMNVEVHSEYRVRLLDSGLGGLLLEEVPVTPHVKDLSQYERATEYETLFNIATWRFFMAFDGETPVGALTLAGPTEHLYMLNGRTDACVLWDIRVADGYKHQGIGQQLFDMALAAARETGYRQMIIECQNNNVPACRFYRKQGAVLGKIDRYAYYDDPMLRDETQLIWYLDL
ncbi:MAG: GNAT family N-acetyltransferase [Clostridia bacterium]|nr:GNAT family N-acetyltransferase [Clostridia bacterium]